MSNANIIPENRRQTFISDLFSNIRVIQASNRKLLDNLVKRQREGYIVEKLGDIFIQASNEFYAYVYYGANQVFAKSLLESEKANNPDFSKFLRVCKL